MIRRESWKRIEMCDELILQVVGEMVSSNGEIDGVHENP
jgi:hypothetical protein